MFPCFVNDVNFGLLFLPDDEIFDVSLDGLFVLRKGLLVVVAVAVVAALAEGVRVAVSADVTHEAVLQVIDVLGSLFHYFHLEFETLTLITFE